MIREFVDLLVKKPSPLRILTHLCITTDINSIITLQSKRYLRRIATLPSVKYFGLSVHQGFSEGWIRLIRNSSGGYAGYEIDESVEPVSKWWDFSTDV
jgi:hypothetical protein